AASTMPISTATVRSTTTVKLKAVRKTTASLRGHLGNRLKLCHSPMLSATLTNTALKVASGINFASGAAAKIITSSVTAWTMPAMGVRAPHLMFVAVRAIAPVVNHPVGNHRAEQRFNRSEQRDGGGGLKKMLDVFPGERRNVWMRQRLRNAAELA